MNRSDVAKLFIQASISLKQALQILNETAEKILFVVDDQTKLLGTVTDGDVRRGIIRGLEFEAEIENIMNRNFISIRYDSNDIMAKARQLMVEKKLESIPILDEDGKIADLIFWIDILGEKQKTGPRKRHTNPVVIMAGGKGTRMDPFTRILPKPLIPIGDKPVIELIMEKFNECGFSKFIYTLNYKKEYLKLYLKENRFQYDIEWVEEDDFLGTAGGLSLLKNKIAETFFLTNCDSLLSADFEDILKWHYEHKAAMTIVGCHNEVNIPFGVLQLSNGRVDRILEKPVHHVIINTGVYVMEPDVLSLIPDEKHMNMNELIDTLAKEGKIAVYPIYDGWLDVGQWDEYIKNISRPKTMDDKNA